MSVNPYAPPTAVVEDVSAQFQPTGHPAFFPVSITKLVLLSMCTFNLYTVYWFYKNWKHVNQHETDKVWPAVRAFFAVFFCHSLFQRVRDFQRPSGEACDLAAGWLAVFWIITTLLHKLPDPYWWISLLAFVFLIPVQAEVNRLNTEVAPGHNPNARLSVLNWVVLVLGGPFVALAIVGTLAQKV